MKKILNSLTILAVTTTTAVSPNIVNNNLKVHNNQIQDLGTIANRLTEAIVTININLGATYSQINKAIYNTATVFQQHPLFGNYTVNYFSDNAGQNNINNQQQAAGTVYVVITADPLDPYWKGHTNPLAVTISKATLTTVTSLAGMLPILVDNTKTYSQINPQLYNQALAFAVNQLATGFTVNYFSDAAGTKNINTQKQSSGNFYVQITAAANDPYWKDSTAVISMALNKVDLTTVNTLAGMLPINIVPGLPNSSISTALYNGATAFATHNLTGNFAVHYYSDPAGKNNIDSQLQIGGPVYVTITADPTDPYWQGTTQPISLTLTDGRIDLNTVSDLSGMTPIIVNPNSTFGQIDKNIINTSNQLSLDPLTGNFIVNYYADRYGTININDQVQTSGVVYVMVIPDQSTGTHWKASVSPIAITILPQ